MKRWMERLVSNKYLRVALIGFFALLLFALFDIAFLMQARSWMTPETFSVWVAVSEIIIMTLGSVVTISVIIMGIRLIIYGNEVRHDRAYWEDTKPGRQDRVMEVQNDPYLLPVRIRNPIVPFMLLVGCYNIMPLVVVGYHFRVAFDRLIQIVIAFVIEYVMIVALVVFVRLLRRLRPFRVRKFNSFR